MPEITEIGSFYCPNVEIHPTSDVRCPTCRQLYQISFDRRFICLTCDPNKQIYAMILSLKQQLNNETESRMYSGSAKAFDDYKHNIIEPQLEQFAEAVRLMKQTIAAQNKVIIELNKKVKQLETKAKRSNTNRNAAASPSP